MTVPPRSADDPGDPNDSKPPPPPNRAVQSWPDTDHSALERLRDGSTAEKEQALRNLFLAYSTPLKRYIHQAWPMLSQADIDDLAAEFSTRCLTGENAHFLTYDSTRDGPPVRLRTYLCRVLDNYLTTKYRHAHAQMRGGLQRFESLDTTNPAAHQERPFESSGTPSGFDTDAYDRHWAQHVLSIAFHALESGNSATQASLHILRPWILADPGEATLKELAQRQGRTHAALRAQLHRLRKSWRHAVRHAVAQTVSHPDDIDDELRHLATVLSKHPPE
jgi:hypothetical protein